MIDRYKVVEVEQIWSDENKFNNWLKIELLVCEALNKLKILPDEDLKDLKKITKININKIHDLEKELKHDVVAFTRSLSLEINSKAKRWIHFGLTSTDIVDTSNSINFKSSNQIIVKYLFNLLNILKQLAIKYKYQKQIGRTHGVHAQANSLGLKFLNYYEMINRWLNQFNNIKKEVEVIKLSGAIGNYAFQNPLIEEYVAKSLDMEIAHFSTQVISRERHSLYFSFLANLGLIINNIATEIRHLHRTEVNEVCEGFSENQKGSSAMPHKKNPVICENICGMNRLLTRLCQITWDNVCLWHERDISHSSNERIVFNDAISTLVYMTQKMTHVLENITININSLDKNISLTKLKNNSQAVMLYLILKTKDTREEIYDFIQSIVLKDQDLILELQKSKYKHLFLNENLEEYNKFSDELRYIDYIYKKIGL